MNAQVILWHQSNNQSQSGYVVSLRPTTPIISSNAAAARAILFELSAPEIVEIRLGRKADGSIARNAPFMVIAANPERSSLYRDEPDVIAQLAPQEDRGLLRRSGMAHGSLESAGPDG